MCSIRISSAGKWPQGFTPSTHSPRARLRSRAAQLQHDYSLLEFTDCTEQLTNDGDDPRRRQVQTRVLSPAQFEATDNLDERVSEILRTPSALFLFESPIGGARIGRVDQCSSYNTVDDIPGVTADIREPFHAFGSFGFL